MERILPAYADAEQKAQIALLEHPTLEDPSLALIAAAALGSAAAAALTAGTASIGSTSARNQQFWTLKGYEFGLMAWKAYQLSYRMQRPPPSSSRVVVRLRSRFHMKPFIHFLAEVIVHGCSVIALLPVK